MKVLLVSSEATPFAKTGGLADVAGALPIELAALGIDIRLAMPKYAAVDDAEFSLLPILHDIEVQNGIHTNTAIIKRTVLPDTSVPVYFVDNPLMFDRPGLYGEAGVDYPDNALRFAFFCKAVIWLLKGLDWVPDVIHCNDWQTALIPMMLQTEPEMRDDAELRAVRTLFTIHNLAYQGVFTFEAAREVGLPESLFQPAGIEFYDQVSYIKAGIQFSDWITTVSPTYASEILTQEFGCGLEGTLKHRRGMLSGVLNGIDFSTWNPESDPHLPANFSAEDLAGKAVCKETVLKEAGLEESKGRPLVVMISRLDAQKGIDLVLGILPDLMAGGAQLIVLGTGAPQYHKLLEAAAARYPGQMAAVLKFDNGLAHRMEAGADIFLMPSRYEPCGLNQLYSLRYGTVPVVRSTGGLADSVEPVSANGKSGTGFVFEQFDRAAFWKAVEAALKLYPDQSVWLPLVRRGMAKDFSWAESARRYSEIYSLLAR